MSGTTWVHESTFSTVRVVKSEYRSSISFFFFRSSISDENLVPELRCTVSVNFTPDTEDLV